MADADLISRAHYLRQGESLAVQANQIRDLLAKIALLEADRQALRGVLHGLLDHLNEPAGSL